MSSNAEPEVIKEAWLYKMTLRADVVVKRKFQMLAGGVFLTFHDYENSPESNKTWYLDRRCQLDPSNAQDILKPVQTVIRPKGQWTVSTVAGECQRLVLYAFTIYWPKRWFAKGYSNITIGSEDLDEARQWHAAFAGAINALQKAAVRDGADLAVSTKPPKSFSVSANTPTVQARFASVTASAKPDECFPIREAPAAATGAGGSLITTSELQDGSSLLEEEEEEEEEGGMHPSRWRNLAERWVPYKQTNGVAIYRLDAPATVVRTVEEGMGGEYMVSAVVRGPPSCVLGALMHGSSHTTILGPASVVEVLDSSKAMDNSTTEVLRLVLEAEGWTGRLCAPREMIVERVLRSDTGMHVVQFSSVQRSGASSGQNGTWKFHSLYKRPVQGWVRGTYVIAPLQGHNLKTSPETMITCIIKVNLCGVFGEASWLHPLAGALGWADAFLDRILMSVILVRDDVEHSRFVLDWQEILCSAKEAEKEKVAEIEIDAASAATVLGGAGARSLMMQGRLASMRRISSNSAAEAPLTDAQKPPMPDIGEAPEEQLPEEVILDLERVRAMATMESHVWQEIHAPGAPCPFEVRGPTYLKDHRKIQAGCSAFTLASLDMVALPHAVEHVARYLPSIRESGAPFAFVVNLIIPGNPRLSLVAQWVIDKHPSTLGKPPANPMEDDEGWKPFDLVLHRFITGDDGVRSKMLKLIPRIANGGFLIRNAVGTKPVIIGKALPMKYYMTEQYIQCDIDVSANSTAAYATSMVRSSTKSLVIDMGFVLEGTNPWELPECLLGGFRLNNLDVSTAKPLDISKEIPLRPAATLAMAYPAEQTTVNTW